MNVNMSNEFYFSDVDGAMNNSESLAKLISDLRADINLDCL